MSQDRPRQIYMHARRRMSHRGTRNTHTWQHRLKSPEAASLLPRRSWPMRCNSFPPGRISPDCREPFALLMKAVFARSVLSTGRRTVSPPCSCSAIKLSPDQSRMKMMRNSRSPPRPQSLSRNRPPVASATPQDFQSQRILSAFNCVFKCDTASKSLITTAGNRLMVDWHFLGLEPTGTE